VAGTSRATPQRNQGHRRGLAHFQASNGSCTAIVGPVFAIKLTTTRRTRFPFKSCRSHSDCKGWPRGCRRRCRVEVEGGHPQADPVQSRSRGRRH